MSRFYSLEVERIDHNTTNSVLIRFRIPKSFTETFHFSPGQYVTLEKTIDEKSVRRSYSICSSPKDPLEVGIKEVPNGVFSTYANTKIKAGDLLDVSVPEGRFVYQEKAAAEKITAFAAGSGITPIMSILKSVLASNPKNKFHLVYGNKTPEETMFYQELKALEQEFAERLSITWVFSRSEETGAIFGRIDQDVVKNYLNNEAEKVSSYFLCGPEQMIDTTAELLKERGVDPSAILHELFFTEAPSNVAYGDKNEITIICDDVSHTLQNMEGKTILEAALQEKIEVPYSCQGGVCSSCIARVEEGTATMETNQILSDEEVEEGLILTCQAIVTSSSIRVNFDDV